MAKKNYIRLDRVSKTAHYESVASDTIELLAGQFVKLGTVLDSSEGELVGVEKATAAGEFDAIVVPVYLDKGYPDYDITTDSVKTGKAARALHPTAGTILSINAENAPGLKKGDKVVVGEDGLGFKKAEDGETAVATVISLEYLTNIGDLVVVRF
ncbi:hypothetical protein [Enterococcus sp. N249-2]